MTGPSLVMFCVDEITSRSVRASVRRSWRQSLFLNVTGLGLLTSIWWLRFRFWGFVEGLFECPKSDSWQMRSHIHQHHNISFVCVQVCVFVKENFMKCFYECVEKLNWSRYLVNYYYLPVRNNEENHHRRPQKCFFWGADQSFPRAKGFFNNTFIFKIYS